VESGKASGESMQPDLAALSAIDRKFGGIAIDYATPWGNYVFVALETRPEQLTVLPFRYPAV
jgi:hypothetical protein